MTGIFESLPPEAQEVIQAQYDHARMHQTDNIHSLHRFLDELKQEHLQQLDTILGSLLSNDNMNWYIRGLIISKLNHKFDQCACGETHDPEDLVAPTAEQTKDLNLRYTAGEMPWWVGDEFSIDIFLLKCDEWGVTPASPWDREGDCKVICDGCGTLSQSLQDRMLRRPKIEGCYGCQHKSAHG